MDTVTFLKLTLRNPSVFLIIFGSCFISPNLFSRDENNPTPDQFSDVRRVKEPILLLAGDTVHVVATATPDSICAGASSQLLATVTGGTGPYTFSWTPVTGLDNPGIANPVASPTITTRYHVSVVDADSHTGIDSTLVRIIPTPDSPGTINGPSVVCDDSSADYSIQNVPGANSYSWTVPSGTQILSGQNTTEIVVRWGENDGNISVIAGNQCGNSNPSVLAVTITGLPPQPATILGPAQVCNSATVIYSVNPLVPEATSYFWTVPPDAAIVSGQSSDSIFVHWGANAGNIGVVAINSCGTSSPRNRAIGLETLPEPAGSITGNDTVCSNYEEYTYTVPVIPGATSYVWASPPGTTITSGSGTNTVVIKIDPAAISGPVTVEGNNTCGSGTPGFKNISVKICAGISEHGKETGIAVFPNPAEGVLNLTIANEGNKIKLQIMDAMGQIVYSESLYNIPVEYTHKIDVSGFSRGMYFLEMVSDTRLVIKKIILH